MYPTLAVSIETRRSLSRSTSQPNLSPSSRALVNLPRRSNLSRSHTSLELVPRDRGGGGGGRAQTAEGDEAETGSNSHPAFEGIATDLGEIIQERKRARDKTTREGGGGGNFGEEEEEEDRKDSIQSLILPALENFDDDEDGNGNGASNLAPIAREGRMGGWRWRARAHTEEEEEGEEDSKSWNPEVFTSRLVSKGAGGGGRGSHRSRDTKGKHRVIYDVPEEKESWDAKDGLSTIELVEDISTESVSRWRRSSWSYDKLFSSASCANRKEDLEEKEASRVAGKTRALERLRLVENQLSWAI